MVKHIICSGILRRWVKKVSPSPNSVLCLFIYFFDITKFDFYFIVDLQANVSESCQNDIEVDQFYIGE